MNKEVMFTACNIPKFLEEQMSKLKESITCGMTEDEIKVYDFAIDTVLSILRQTIHAAEIDGEVFVHGEIGEDKEIEEFDLHDLLELFSCRVVAQKECN